MKRTIQTLAIVLVTAICYVTLSAPAHAMRPINGATNQTGKVVKETVNGKEVWKFIAIKKEGGTVYIITMRRKGKQLIEAAQKKPEQLFKVVATWSQARNGRRQPVGLKSLTVEKFHEVK